MNWSRNLCLLRHVHQACQTINTSFIALFVMLMLLAGGGTTDVQKHSETTGHKSWRMLCEVII